VVHLQGNGFDVDERNTTSLASVKERLRVPARLQTCHTGEVGGYIIEGHVPADVVQRLLAERPGDIAGIGVAGMPIGSPGMEVPGRPNEAYDVVAWDRSGRTWIYDSR
jgi:hypothetical protein